MASAPESPTVAAASPAPVIKGKIAVPALGRRYRPRERIEQRIADAVGRRRAVVVAATAGAGKTTAVVAGLRDQNRPVAWLTVDRSERAPGRLLTYLEAALARVAPVVEGVVADALAAGLSHHEAAGLLAEALDDVPVVLVLDELERLDVVGDAWAVLEALLRYAPPSASFVLISRRDVPTHLCALPSPETVVVVRDSDLAFTPDEAREALAGAGRPDADAHAIVESTAGWVTGVLFEAWRAADEQLGLDGTETDPMFEYLSAHILGQLSLDDREFLVRTSLLDEVDVARAEALGEAEAAARLASLEAVHLPAVWDGERGSLRLHSFFREYLQHQLARRGTKEVRELRRRVADSLAAEGLHEEAAEELLRGELPELALESVRQAIVQVVDRADFAVAERWLDAVDGVAPPDDPVLLTARMMVAVGRDQLRRAVRIADALTDEQRRAVASSSERVLWPMVWAYLHMARMGDVQALLELAPPGLEQDAVRWAMRALDDVPEAVEDVPEATGNWVLDAMVHIGNYPFGRLTTWLQPVRESAWATSMEAAFRVAALRGLGRTAEALELLEQTRSAGNEVPGLRLFAGAEVLMDLGRIDEAEAELEVGRQHVSASGSVAWMGLHRVTEAKLAVRHRDEPERALQLVDAPDFAPAKHGLGFLRDVGETWAGLALLRLGRDDEALARLRACVQGMQAADRLLELPTAAVYLAEAEWRAGNEDEADAAADVALEAADRQGSRHLLLQALTDVPAVLARRLDAEPGQDSAWHGVAAAMAARRGVEEGPIAARVELIEFGRRAIVVDGVEVRPRIGKSYELLAYLATLPGGSAGRETLTEALFDGRTDDAARAYLRQAIRWLRQALPEGTLDVDDRRVGLAGPVASESRRLRRDLALAAGLQGDARLTATLAALEPHDRGEYLPGARGSWADERGRELDRLALDARHQAAVVAYGAGRLHEARSLAERVLEADPYREAVWRLGMRVADALGDADGVLRAYQGCAAALAQLGARPSQGTESLMATLRGSRSSGAAG